MDNNESLLKRGPGGLTVKLLSGSEWVQLRTPIMRELDRWGGGRLTDAGMAALAAARADELSPAPGEQEPAAAIAAAFVGGRLAGAAFARSAGEAACLVAVHPKARGRRLGSLLLEQLLKLWGRLQCMVAADNTASLKMCFRAGMAAVSLYEGPTGKPTLLFKAVRSPAAEQGGTDGGRKAPGPLHAGPSPDGLQSGFASGKTYSSGLRSGFASDKTHSSGLRSGFASGKTHSSGLRSGFASGKTHSSGLRSGFASGKTCTSASGKTLRSGEIDPARTWHSNFIPQ